MNNIKFALIKLVSIILIVLQLFAVPAEASSGIPNRCYQNFHPVDLTDALTPGERMAKTALAQYQDDVGNVFPESKRNRSYFGYTTDWCAFFLYDCAVIAGQETAIPFNGGYAYQSYDGIIAMGGQVVEPKDVRVGDVAVYDFDCKHGYQHVEVVVAVVGKKIYSVGGNTGKGFVGLHQRVDNRYYNTDKGRYIEDVTCYVRPAYRNLVVDGMYALSPKCAPNSNLDIDGGSDENGSNAIIWNKHEGDNQKFYINYNEGMYTLTSVSGGKPLDVQGGETESGTNVQQYEANGTESQRWYIAESGDGYYYIISALDSSLYLDVCGGESRNGNNVQVYTGNQTDSQKWKLTRLDSPVQEITKITTGKYHTIKNAQSGKMLNVWRNGNQNGTNITIWQEDGTNGEAFCAIEWTNGFYLVPQCAMTSAVNVRGYQGDFNRNVDVWQQTQHDSQLWKLVYNNDLKGYHLLCVEDPTQALAEMGTENGANVCLKAYDTSDLSQIWISEMFNH